MSRRVSIVKRYTHLNGVRMRVLNCGHEQQELRGGKAAQALFVQYCVACALAAAADAAAKEAPKTDSEIAHAEGNSNFDTYDYGVGD